VNERELIEARNRLWARMQELMTRARDEGHSLSAEEAEEYDRLEGELQERTAELEQLRTDTDRERRFADLERVQRDVRLLPSASDPARMTPAALIQTREYADAWLAYARSGMASLSGEQRSMLQYGYVPVEGGEQRAQTLATGAGGGYLVPDAFRNVIVETMRFYGGMRQVAQVITTETGADLPWVTNDDTGNEGEILNVDASNPSYQDVVFGQKTLRSYPFSSKWVKVPLVLLNDSFIDLGAFLGRKLGERIGRRENRAYTTGSGTGEPEGVVTGVSVGKLGANGQTTTVTWQDFVHLTHSIDRAYRNERSRFMAHDLTIAAVRLMVDGDARPLWEPSIQAGQPDTLFGYPITYNNDMPQMAANAKSIIFGDFEAGYVIRQVMGISAVRAEERFIDNLQVGFLSWARMDGMVQDPNALRAYQNAAS
jgi:HK97 family phage major capsid protein